MTEDGGFVSITTDDPTVNIVSTDYDELRIRSADAYLIAAAPDLLAALRAAVAMYGPSTEYGHDARMVWEQAEAAIKNAEGTP